jgi:succinylglutamate desuccinylase
MIKTISYETINSGISLCIMGAVHGNEKCGTIAINRIMHEIESGYIELSNGSLHLMPIANPRAYTEDVRFIQRNLNRYLYKKEVNNDYEDYLDAILCNFIEKGDFLLDLHSYASQTNSKEEAFIFLSGNDKKEIDYAKNVGVKNFIYGWQQAFSDAEDKDEEDDKKSQGTTEYARLHGITAITLECGQHLSKTAPDNAYQAIIKSLIYLNMLMPTCQAYINNSNNSLKLSEDDLLCIHMQDVYYRNDGDNLYQDWKHFEPVNQGQILAYRKNGDNIIAKQDGYILLPKLNASTGGEWFYFGVRNSFEDIE